MPNTARIQVIEADNAIREALVAVLDSLGWAVEAYDSADLWREAQPAAAQCIIVDADCAGADCERVLKEATAVSMPVVVIGSGVSSQRAVDLMHSGAVEFLEMPFSHNRLKSILATLV